MQNAPVTLEMCTLHWPDHLLWPQYHLLVCVLDWCEDPVKMHPDEWKKHQSLLWQYGRLDIFLGENVSVYRQNKGQPPTPIEIWNVRWMVFKKTLTKTRTITLSSQSLLHNFDSWYYMKSRPSTFHPGGYYMNGADPKCDQIIIRWGWGWYRLNLVDDSVSGQGRSRSSDTESETRFNPYHP